MSNATTIVATVSAFALGAAFSAYLFSNSNSKRASSSSSSNNHIKKNKKRKLTIAYWKMRGLGAPLRMMAFYCGRQEGIDVEYKCFDAGAPDSDDYKKSWFGVKEKLYTPQNPMANLPWVKAEDEHSSEMIVQTNACLTFLGRELGLDGRNRTEKNRIDQVLAQTMDWRNSAVSHFYGRKKENINYYNNNVRTHYKKLNNFVLMNQTKFSASNVITLSDFHLFEMIDQHESFYSFLKLPSFLKDYNELYQIHKSMKESPKLKLYFESKYYKEFPMNNPHAYFLH
jgi:hypothetical protein